MVDSDDSSESDTDSLNKYHYLAGDKFSADDIDFSDPTALLMRQKAILETIKKHQSKENFDPLRILNKGIGIWVVILCHGGKFLL